MNPSITNSRIRLFTSLLITLLLGGVLLVGQKMFHAIKGQIFYFQGKPGTLFFAFFASTIAVYFYILTKRVDGNGQLLKKWCLTINTILFVVLLPLQVFSMDSYFYISDKAVVESSFWHMGDKETIQWKDLKKSVLTVLADANGNTVSIINRLVFQNGKIYDINISTIGKREFSKLYAFLKQENMIVEVQRLNKTQLRLVKETYGPQVVQLFTSNQ